MIETSPHQRLETKLTSLLSSYNERSDTHGVQFALRSPSRNWGFEWSPSGRPEQYFIASTTKLYVTALIMQLRQEGLVDLDTPASKYLDPAIMAGIHIFRGVDSSQRITVRELLSHTSGIADYFEQRRPDGSSQIKDALAQDFAWSLDDVLRITKDELKPKFAPSSPGKAFYSDTNFQILGALIEEVTSSTFESAVQDRVIDPLGLRDTFPFSLETLERYAEIAPILYGKQRVIIPKVMASVRADGGMVSTANDGLTFLEGFMTGKLFPSTYIEAMQQDWRRIFFPFEYGLGIMRFALPRIFSPFRAPPEMVGHSGASGVVLYFVPELDLYISGTVNQLKNRSLPYNLMVRLVFTCEDTW